jgi:micrococcal nuclease
MIRKKIKKWHDGDSGVFSNGEKFRLARVRAPEKNRKGGSTALRSASGMSSRTNGRVSVERVARDKYGRSIVEIKNKHGSINDRLRKKGYTNKGR